jgi:hypothetical protein
VAAVVALADWPDAGAWDALMTVYRTPATEAQRGQALHGLVRLAGELSKQPDAKLVDRYRSLLNAVKGPADVRLILSALGGAAHPEALQLAVSLLSSPAVRAEAAAAVKQIANAIKAQHAEAAADALKRIAATQ